MGKGVKLVAFYCFFLFPSYPFTLLPLSTFPPSYSSLLSSLSQLVALNLARSSAR